MLIPSLYLDTSVIGGYFDDEWQEATRELWRQMEAGQWRFVTSIVTAEEIALAPEPVRDLLAAFAPEDIFDITEEMRQLALAYVAQGVVTPKYTDDARHVAACTVLRSHYLVSWNFRHLVNVQRSAGFNAVNLLRGYTAVRIVNPLQLIYGNEDQKI